jgi:hemoglobin
METGKSLYQRLGGYDAIAAVCNDLLPRLMSDPLLGRFWQHRAGDSIAREKQSLINFLCASSGGSMYYFGRDMKISHKGKFPIKECASAKPTGKLFSTI